MLGDSGQVGTAKAPPFSKRLSVQLQIQQKGERRDLLETEKPLKKSPKTAKPQNLKKFHPKTKTEKK